MHAQTRSTCDVRLDLHAFERNQDGSWTVLEDTKVYSSETDHADTLLLPGGTVIETRMFWTNNIDLIDILNWRCDRPVASLTQTQYLTTGSH